MVEATSGLLLMLEAMLRMLYVGLQTISEDTADLGGDDATGKARDVEYAGGETPTAGVD